MVHRDLDHKLDLYSGVLVYVDKTRSNSRDGWYLLIVGVQFDYRGQERRLLSRDTLWIQPPLLKTENVVKKNVLKASQGIRRMKEVYFCQLTIYSNAPTLEIT